MEQLDEPTQEMKLFTKEAYNRLKYLIEKGDEDYRNIYLVCFWLERTEKKLKEILELK